MLRLVTDEDPGFISPESLPRPGEVALLTAIDAALRAQPEQLPSRVALVRRYIEAALDSVPGSRRTRFQVIAQMLARDVIQAIQAEENPVDPP